MSGAADLSADLEAAVEAAAAALAAGQVVAIPTDTVYGLAVDFRIDGATERLFAVKGRPDSAALPVLVGDPAEAADLGVLGPAARRLIDTFWPGPLTLVVARRSGVDADLGGDPATIGLRCPDHEIARCLLARSGPLAVSSANRHGEEPFTSADAVRAGFGDEISYVLDAPTGGGSPSTVVALRGSGTGRGAGGIDHEQPEVLRSGAISADSVAAALANSAPFPASEQGRPG